MTKLTDLLIRHGNSIHILENQFGSVSNTHQATRFVKLPDGIHRDEQILIGKQQPVASLPL